MKIGISSRLYFPDSFANFFLVAELAFIEPEHAFFDLKSSKIHKDHSKSYLKGLQRLTYNRKLRSSQIGLSSMKLCSRPNLMFEAGDHVSGR